MHSGCNQAKVSEHAYPLVYKQNGGSAEAGADGSSCRTRAVVVEIKYISAQNVVIHTENCKLELLLNCSVTQVEMNVWHR